MVNQENANSHICHSIYALFFTFSWETYSVSLKGTLALGAFPKYFITFFKVFVQITITDLFVYLLDHFLKLIILSQNVTVI